MCLACQLLLIRLVTVSWLVVGVAACAQASLAMKDSIKHEVWSCVSLHASIQPV